MTAFPKPSKQVCNDWSGQPKLLVRSVQPKKSKPAVPYLKSFTSDLTASHISPVVECSSYETGQSAIYAKNADNSVFL